MHSENRFSKKLRFLYLFSFAVLLLLAACRGTGTDQTPDETIPETAGNKETDHDSSPDAMEESRMELTITINEQTIPVMWETNESVEALKQLVAREPLTVEMKKYGGFEQVGPLGTSLPHENTDMTTRAGDVVLYSGNQIVVFYGSNNWSYTRLGTITGLSEQQLQELLGTEDVTLTILSSETAQ